MPSRHSVDGRDNGTENPGLGLFDKLSSHDGVDIPANLEHQFEPIWKIHGTIEIRTKVDLSSIPLLLESSFDLSHHQEGTGQSVILSARTIH